MATPLRYQIVVAWSDEDGCYVAHVPAFGPAIAAHGDTPDDAAREARVAAELCIESLREHGEPLPVEDITNVAAATSG
jgi:predicted RNase H-like HicB family nuclease